MTFIHTPTQREWLVRTHLPNVSPSSFVYATLVGSEDGPQCIVLYTTKGFRSLPRVFICDSNGIYQEQAYRR